MLSTQSAIWWEAYGPRIMTASFYTKKKRIDVNINQCYALINDSEEDERKTFTTDCQTSYKTDQTYTSSYISLLKKETI
ncbi:hypothetical protein DPMN_137463 [Dreissena polymorpha]|uniref:Uncharacterized protein n=1 Tax=Dreissena polymorpha TaxID=45954 RepID=A0A9D4G5T4_DREPO|nr:hypothetical protein DPMN_137463 [Dreissena polymorpha]